LDGTFREIQQKWPSVQVLAVAGEVGSEKFIDGFVEEVDNKFGRVDYCVNCAGVLGQVFILSQNYFTPAYLTHVQAVKSGDTSIEEFDRVNSVNYRGCWLSSRAQIRAMLKQVLHSYEVGRPGQKSSVVNIASQLGIVGRTAARKFLSFYLFLF